VNPPQAPSPIRQPRDLRWVEEADWTEDERDLASIDVRHPYAATRVRAILARRERAWGASHTHWRNRAEVAEMLLRQRETPSIDTDAHRRPRWVDEREVISSSGNPGNLTVQTATIRS
jgi:hypothetical protein